MIRHFLPERKKVNESGLKVPSFSLFSQLIDRPHIENYSNWRRNTLRIVRTMSSVPPDHGAAAVGHILCDEKLSNEWVLELNDTRNRLKNMRMELSNALKAKTDTSDFSHIEKANGMFSYLGISPTQVLNRPLHTEIHQSWFHTDHPKVLNFFLYPGYL